MTSQSAVPAKETLALDFTSVGPDSGGVGVVASGVARGLQAAEIPFRCVVSSETHDAWIGRVPELAAELRPVKVRLAANSRWQRALRRVVPRSSRVTQKIIGRVRSIRAHSSAHALGNGVVWRPFHRALATGERDVVTVHDLRVFEPGLVSRMDQEIIKRNIGAAAAIVCSWAHPFQSVLERFPFARDKTFLVPLPVLNSGPWRERAAPTERDLRLLLPGFVTPHKNHEIVIRALPQLPGAQVVFTGSGDGRYVDHLRLIAEEVGVADRIEWLGFVNATRLEAEYARADLLVMPTRWEAASGPVFEAIVRGLPFVASDIPPISSQLAALGLDARTFDCDSADELVVAILNTVKDYEGVVQRLRPFSESLRGRTWESTALDYNRVFDWVGGVGEKPEELMKRVPS